MELPSFITDNWQIKLAVLISLIIVISIYSWFVGDRETIIDDMIPAGKTQAMPSTVYQVNSPEKGLGFTTSIWLHIRDWNYKYGQEKVVFQKGALKMYIDKSSNDLKIDVPVYPYMKTMSGPILDTSKMMTETLVYPNIPLQKWIHVIVILDNRSLDLWMNGKLYVSKYLGNIPKIDNKAPFVLFPGGGFDGWAGRIVHYRYPITKKVIQSIYWAGPIDLSFLGDITRFFRLWFRRIRNLFKFNISFQVEMDEETRKFLEGAREKVSTATEGVSDVASGLGL